MISSQSTTLYSAVIRHFFTDIKRKYYKYASQRTLMDVYLQELRFIDIALVLYSDHKEMFRLVDDTFDEIIPYGEIQFITDQFSS